MKKIKQNEQGMAHVMLIVLAVVVLGVVGYAGWKVMKHKSTNNPTTASNTAVDNSCLNTYHDANLCHFASHSTSLDKVAYTAALKITDTQGTVSSMSMSNDGKGNTSSILGSGTQQVATISLNGATYIQSGGSGAWIEYPAGASGTPASSSPTSGMDIGVGNSGVGFKYVSTQACGSYTCYKYQVTATTQPNATQYVLFDKDSYLLREWLSTNPASGSVDMTINYGSVNISKPSPVRQFSAY